MPGGRNYMPAMTHAKRARRRARIRELVRLGMRVADAAHRMHVSYHTGVRAVLEGGGARRLRRKAS